MNVIFPGFVSATDRVFTLDFINTGCFDYFLASNRSFSRIFATVGLP